MERISEEVYSCGGRSFSIETHQKGRNVSFCVVEQLCEGPSERTAIANHFLSPEESPVQMLASPLYKRYLKDIKHRISVYINQWQPPQTLD